MLNKLTPEQRKRIINNPGMPDRYFSEIFGVSITAVCLYRKQLLQKRQERANKRAIKRMGPVEGLKTLSNARGERIGDIVDAIIEQHYRGRAIIKKVRNVRKLVRSWSNPSVCVELRYTVRGPVRPYLAD